MSEELLRKASEMRNAIDMIEGALMGLGDFVDLPDLFEGTAEHVNLAPPMTVGEVRRVCTALAECTRIINSDEFDPDELRRHASDAAELQQTFDLQWAADMRAVKMWREAHPGNELVLPDRANMVVWLLEEHDALKHDVERYVQITSDASKEAT